jgi:DAACS family dicarboxylate/amino acid:cation (Na+ or H+) symporter
VSNPANGRDRGASRIVWGLVAGLVGGLLAQVALRFFPVLEPRLHWVAGTVLEPFGQIFLRLLFLVVVPLVFASLTLGIVQLGRLDRLGPLAARTFGLFALNMTVGVALGLVVMNAARPGARVDEATRAKMLSAYAAAAQDTQARAADQRATGFSLAVLVEMFLPRNLLKSVVEFQLLPLILFALLVGAAGTLLPEERRAPFQSALEITGDLMTQVVHWAMRLAPYAVAALLAAAVIRFGLDVLKSLLLFVGVVIGAMLVHLFGTMSLLLRLLSRRRPLEFFRAARPVLVTAFSTSSSSGTLPTSLQVARENLGVSPATAGFVLPLGATLNMSGTALFEGCTVLFVAQVYGVELGPAQQLVLLLLAVLSAVAVAGIPGGALPLVVGLMTTFGIPAEGIALVLGVDRILDMVRTTLNVAADLVTACIVDESARGQA